MDTRLASVLFLGLIGLAVTGCGPEPLPPHSDLDELRKMGRPANAPTTSASAPSKPAPTNVKDAKSQAEAEMKAHGINVKIN